MPSIFSRLDFIFALALAGLLLTAYLFPELGAHICCRIESRGSRFAQRKGLAIFFVVLAVLLTRIALLPILPIPVPAVSDEFSYLLASDTFAHGHLANPPHPMRMFFENAHVNQVPAYMSKYPPAQGAFLALGQLCGHPWIGVLLSVALMCGSILWMLQGWMPSRWAFLGTLLLFLHLGLFSYWMNSYWGGAVAALGGALVVGAIPRILRYQKPQYALLFALGAAILANSRPLEGFLLCATSVLFLSVALFRRGTPDWHSTLRSVVLPISAVAALTVAFLGYYNWRGTGDPLLFPYTLNDRTYLSTPPFVWQSLEPPRHYTAPQLDAVYNLWARPFWTRTRFAFHLRTVKFLYFFLWPDLCLLLLALPCFLRQRKYRFLLIQFLFCFAGTLMVVWYQPHYSAPLTATVTAILAVAIRHLRHWKFRDRPVGLSLTRGLVLYSLALNLFYYAEAWHNPHTGSLVAPAGVWGSSGNWRRAQINSNLQAHPGRHLVIVRFSNAAGSLSGNWISNAADIDGAPVVWAMEIPGVDIQPLLDYFRGRQVWLLEPSAEAEVRITPYR